MLFVERSNRTERLLEGLSTRSMAPGRDPLAPGIVVVQGPGMERWIAQSIARRHGVCANTSFLFPKTFLEQVFGALSDDESARPNPGWEVRQLTWRVAKRLEAGRGQEDFEPLARHLDAVDGDWRLVQLAGRTANLLDQYITFRPDWIAKWTAADSLPDDRDERWQARLFREVRDEIGDGHMADRAEAFRRAIEGPGREAIEGRLNRCFPDTIEIFAVSALPPLYLSVISDLASLRDVHLSVLSPSRHYWADLWKELRDEAATERAAAADSPRGLFDLGPTTPVAFFLAGLGRLGGDFQRILEDAPAVETEASDRFESAVGSNARPSLLARFQDRLLELDAGDEGQDATADPGRTAKESQIVSRADDSIRVHLCHGPRRELEVVHSILRDAFERDDSLRPEDVIVMSPRIDEISPDIEAVFGGSGIDAPAVPFRIADRGVFRRSPVAEAFRGLLGLLGGRATRSEVLDWLAREPVRARFGLDERAVEQLAEWAQRAGVRFGLDAAHRASMGLAQASTHTWAGGLDRLALAHAVGPSDEVFGGSTSVPLDVAGDPRWLGALGDVIGLLIEAEREIRRPRSIGDWCTWLLSLIEGAFERNDANAHEHVTLRAVATELAKAAGDAAFDAPIPFEAIRERVGEAIESTPAPQAFLAGGVTFCELVPLRAIPFRMVVILGMSDDAFPRGGPAPGFDLMARAPRPGDRTSRNDDRYLFLEALLSVRDRLVLTVPAFDVRDGGDRMSSGVVTELLDTLEALFDLEQGEADAGLRDWLVAKHPLRASSARYFEVDGDARLIGRDAEAFAAATARRAALESGGGRRRRFLSAEMQAASSVAVPDTEPATLDLEAMIARFLRSTRFYARERLRLRLPRPESAIGDLDPIDLDPLTRYGLGRAWLTQLRSGVSAEETRLRLSLNPAMPTGVPGRVATLGLHAEVEALWRAAASRSKGEPLEDLEFELNIDGVEGLGSVRLVGCLDRLWPDGRVAFDFARIGRRAEADLWIRHLVLCAVVEAGASLTPRSVQIGRSESTKSGDRVVVFERIQQPETHLARIFEWAWSVERSPLPFFPRASRDYAALMLEGKSGQAWRAAYQTFEGGEWSRDGVVPEFEEELENQRVWEGWLPLDSSGALPLDHRFDALAESFFRPMLEAREVYRE